MTRIFTAALAATAVLSFFGGMPSLAQQQELPAGCGEAMEMRIILTEEYDEAPIAGGMSANGSVVEMWGNPLTGTWSVIETFPNGVTCLRSGGEAFTVVPQEPNA